MSSTQAPDPFFATDENLALIKRVSVFLNTVNALESSELNVIPHLKKFLGILLANAAQFDESCSVNIEWIGRQYTGVLTEILESPPEKLVSSIITLFVYSYRFLCELEFSQPGDLSFELRRIKEFVHENLDKFSGNDRHQLVYANYIMPANIAKRLIGHPAIGDFRRFSEVVELAGKLKETWDQDLNERQNVLDALQENIKHITTAFNFVGLVNGFVALSRTKKSEMRRSFWALIFLGAVMILPVGTQIGFTVMNIDSIESHKNALVYTLPAVIALEVILLYFFRVVLSQFRSVRAQLLQLDLRVSLCQFIQSYADYSVKIKAQDKTALDRFEELIFSGLVAAEEGLPSTFDGTEQLAKLIKSLRSPA